MTSNENSTKKRSRLWLCGSSDQINVELAKLKFFYGNNFDEHQTYELYEIKDILLNSNFNCDRKTLIYLHGFMENGKSESVHAIVNAYKKRNDHNVIVLDWGELANGNYFLNAVQNLKLLSIKIAEIFLDVFNLGLLKIEQLHFVGHSLGAHMCGIIGRNIIKKSNKSYKLKRISALDPAFPVFYPGVGVKAINKNDAELVDVIHTDAWVYGAPISTGTIDFWPNGGRTLKANCSLENLSLLTENNFCGHRKSWKYWTESVLHDNNECFLAVQAKSWTDYKKGHTHLDNVIQMGINCSINAKPGDYYLQTNNDSPYSKGNTGITYNNNNSSSIVI